MKNFTKKFGKTTFLSAMVLLGAACSSDDEPVVVTTPPEKGLFTGTDVATYASMRTNAHTQKATIDVVANGAWTLYPLKSDGTADFDQPVLSGNTAGAFELPTSGYSQYCFEWGENARGVIASRQLPIQGQPNCRDLGGYKTKDGKYVKWGVMLRSGNLNELTDQDLTYLASVPLRTIIDFRTDEEKEKQPDRVPSSVTKRLEYTIEAGNTSGMEDFYKLIATGDYEAIRQMMILANAAFVSDYQTVFRSYFAAIMDETNLPVMFHCTAGKDRAGFASAMFLSALGVDRETIMKDYLLTNTLTGVTLEGCIGQYGDENLGKAMYYVNSVQLEYLSNAFDTIEAAYGNVETYLVECLQVDIEKLRQIYLY